MIATCLVSGVLGLAPLPRADDGVILRPRFNPGGSFALEIAAEYEVRVADQPLRRVDQSATVEFTPLQTDSDGVSTVRLDFRDLRAEAAGADREPARFRWSRDDRPEPSEEPGDLELLCTALVGSAIELDIAPDGTVRAMRGLGPVVAAARRAPGPAAVRDLGFFEPAALAGNLQSLWRLDTRRAAREPGAAWNISRTIAAGDGRSLRLTMRLRLEQAADGVAVLTGTIHSALDAPAQDPGPADPVLSVPEADGSVRIRWDIARGRVLERTEQRSARWRADLDGGLAGAEAVSTASLSVRAVD